MIKAIFITLKVVALTLFLNTLACGDGDKKTKPKSTSTETSLYSSSDEDDNQQLEDLEGTQGLENFQNSVDKSRSKLDKLISYAKAAQQSTTPIDDDQISVLKGLSGFFRSSMLNDNRYEIHYTYDEVPNQIQLKVYRFKAFEFERERCIFFTPSHNLNVPIQVKLDESSDNYFNSFKSILGLSEGKKWEVEIDTAGMGLFLYDINLSKVTLHILENINILSNDFIVSNIEGSYKEGNALIENNKWTIRQDKDFPIECKERHTEVKTKTSDLLAL